ncbi:MAG: OmpH family outer membrane protein [Paracoccaceae bacterium]
MRLARLLLACLALSGPAWGEDAAPAAAAAAAGAQPAAPMSPVLTLDPERLFAGSAWGQRAKADIEKASVALAAENRAIEADLTAEEKALTEKRKSMTPEAFRAEADAFDARVVTIRQTQDAKTRRLARLSDFERQNFFGAAIPVMGQAMQDRGAVAILDARAIFLSANAIDVTDEMIARIDASVGAGRPPDPATLEDENGAGDPALPGAGAPLAQPAP